MIVHSLDAMPPIQQSAYVVADSGSYAVPPARPVQTASLAPVSVESRASAPLQLSVPSSHGATAAAAALTPMLFMSFAALALLLCARSFTAAGRART
jgi:hypothetical protein